MVDGERPTRCASRLMLNHSSRCQMVSGQNDVEDSYKAYDNDKGFMVLWNEIIFSDNRKKKNRQVSTAAYPALAQCCALLT